MPKKTLANTKESVKADAAIGKAIKILSIIIGVSIVGYVFYLCNKLVEARVSFFIVLAAIVGGLFAAVAVFVLVYGFGELVDDTYNIRKLLSQKLTDSTDPSSQPSCTSHVPAKEELQTAEPSVVYKAKSNPDQELKTGTFGKYPQSSANTPEPIKWYVIAEEKDRKLLVSAYGLDCRKYDASGDSASWENCSLRKWLNGSFIETAFSDEEQQAIISTSVLTADSARGTQPGSITEDKVFLLSASEAERCFKTNVSRQCTPTDYAVSRGASTADSNGKSTCGWWLRSPERDSGRAAMVGENGSIDDYGYRVFFEQNAVRPAMWVKG